MLAQGIPQFCLSPEAVQADIDYIKALGVAIKPNMAIGKDLTIDDLWREGFNAILLASGATGSPRLGIPGENARGVISALPFLREARLGRAEPLRGKVVVIGGGNVGIDAARAALRLGAQEVHIACLESSREMPAFAWETDSAQREGVRVHSSLAPQQIGTDAWGRVAGVDFRRVATFARDDQGRISWTLMEGPGSEYHLDANAVIVAIGQVPDASYLGGNGHVKIDPRGAFVVDPETLATNVQGIFAAGDSVSAPGTVVESMAAGQKSAISIARYLQGQDLKAGRVSPAKGAFRLDDLEKTPRFMPKRARWNMPSIPMEDRVRSFGEVNLGYTAWQAVEEAKRCLNCRMCGNCIFEKDQVCFETSRRLL
jgi:NADPH-dependent glutamate synthase beta subunit-like oxidoreductase